MDNVQVTRLMSENNISGGAISADGTLYVYTVSHGTERSLWVRQVTTGSAVQVVPPANASFWFATFSPGNSYVYYTFKDHSDAAKDGVYRVAALGGVPQFIAKGIRFGLKFSPDGKRLAAYRTVNRGDQELHQLITFDAGGQDERLVFTLPQWSLLRGIAWSPDGSALVYGVKRQTNTDKPIHYIAEIPAAGGTEKILLPEQEKVVFVEAWLPDRSSILLRQREPHSEVYQVWQYFPATGEMARITHDDYSYTSLALAQDGKTLSAFRSFALASIWEGDVNKGEFRQLASGPNSAFNLDWTPSGQIVFATAENEHEFIGIMDADGRQKRLLTGGTDGLSLTPRVSGDGRHLAFMSDRSGSRQVWRLDLDGGNLTQLTWSPTGAGDGILLRDGRTVVYSTYRQQTSSWYLARQSADGTTSALTDTNTYDWDISPDEKCLAVQISDGPTEPRRLEIRELATGRVLKAFALENVEGLRWTRDGTALSFARDRDDRQELVNLPLGGGPERVVTAVPAERLAQFAWSLDGKRLAVVRIKAQNEAVLLRAEVEK
jgi:Tol biopolymer transport system component